MTTPSSQGVEWSGGDGQNMSKQTHLQNKHKLWGMQTGKPEDSSEERVSHLKVGSMRGWHLGSHRENELIRDTKGTFHANMGSIKNRNGMDLTEAEDIKKRWQEKTEELYKKHLHDPDNHTHVGLDILECEVNWALGSITMNKASGGDGIPVELFQILRDGAVKVLHSICQQIWKIQQWPQDWKRSVFIPIPKKGNTQECSNYRTIALISHVSKEMLKILQARLQQYVNRELPDVQAGFRKGRGIRSNCQHPLDHGKSKRVPEKHLFLLY